MFTESNPYSPPVDNGKAFYEWPLWRRILYAIAALLIVYGSCGIYGTWLAYSTTTSIETSAPERIKAFFFDWKANRSKL